MEPGILEEREVPSASVPGKVYRMARSRGGWQHLDVTCDAWTIKGDCYHVRSLNMENGEETTTALAKIEELEDTAIVARITGQITADWVYSFQSGGQQVVGLSVDGVEAAARECAKMGEAIREEWVNLVYEDEHEGRFQAKASRYAISGDGQEILLDVAIRGKRQSKIMHRRDGNDQPDEFWYEKGVSKAVRNAKEVLLPEAVKSEIMAQAVTAGRVRQVAPQQQARPAQARRASPAEREAAGEPMMQTVDHLLAAAKSLNVGLDDEGKVLAALGLTNRMEIGDVQVAFGKLRQMAIAQKAGNGGQ